MVRPRSARTSAAPTASWATGLFAVTVADGHIVAMTRFENTVLDWFGLP